LKLKSPIFYQFFGENIYKNANIDPRCCEFHPKATVGLVAGLSGTASLFQIDGKFNPKIQVDALGCCL
jgi:hypothetical protein